MKQQIIDVNVFWLGEVWEVHGTLFVHGKHDFFIGILLNIPINRFSVKQLRG